MPDKTPLEMQEEKLIPMFGGPGGMGMADKSMLEMSDTNRWVFDSQQSELLIAWRLLHDALVAYDNRKPAQIQQKDPQTGQIHTKTIVVDNWRWMLNLEYLVKTNQLTIGAFSRMQHLRQIVNMTGITGEEEESGNWLQRFFGR